MKTTGMQSALYAFDLDRRMGDANSPAGRIRGSGCIVELQTDAGLTWIGLGGGGCAAADAGDGRSTADRSRPAPAIFLGNALTASSY
jgi:hypothetical protein